MAVFRTIAETRSRLGFDDKPHLNVAIEAEMEIAVETVQDRVRTHVSRVDVIDTFFVSKSMTFPGRPIRRRRAGSSSLIGIFSDRSTAATPLKLSRGFVDLGEPFTIFAASTENGLDLASERVDLQSVEGTGTDHVQIDAERGVLRVNDYQLRNCYVRVTYKAGFLDDEGDPAVFIGPPDWMIRAADIETRILTNSNPIFGRDNITEKEQNRLEGRLNSILRGHARYFPLTHWKTVHCEETASVT